MTVNSLSLTFELSANHVNNEMRCRNQNTNSQKHTISKSYAYITVSNATKARVTTDTLSQLDCPTITPTISSCTLNRLLLIFKLIVSQQCIPMDSRPNDVYGTNDYSYSEVNFKPNSENASGFENGNYMASKKLWPSSTNGTLDFLALMQNTAQHFSTKAG